MKIISLVSTLITFAFTYAVFRRYQRKGGAHLAHWAFGLFLYGLGTMSEFILGLTFNGWVLKIWYLTGAMLTAAWLGQGSLVLLIRKKNLAPGLSYALGLVSAVALILLLAAPLTGAAGGFNINQPVSTQYREILSRNGLTIALTILLNIYGTFGLFGGALYSAFLFWRKQVLAGRMFGNILIAAGALAPAMAGTLIRLGLVDALYISELIGSLLMFAGFILATSGKDTRATPAASSQPA